MHMVRWVHAMQVVAIGQPGNQMGGMWGSVQEALGVRHAFLLDLPVLLQVLGH